MNVIFLPGMDGTGRLFQPLLALWNEQPSPTVIPYPSDPHLDYDALVSYVLSQLPTNEPYILLAESFGGPIAVRIASRHPPALRGLILSATFIQRPQGWFGRWGRFLLGRYIFSGVMKEHIFKRILKYQGLSESLVQLLLPALNQVPASVLSARLKEALKVDALEDFQRCEIPVLCLYAKRDWLLPPCCHELIQKTNPRVRLVGLDTPHFLLQTRPAEALQAIQTFVQQIR